MFGAYNVQFAWLHGFCISSIHEPINVIENIQISILYN
jgi:hypothetical protein